MTEVRFHGRGGQGAVTAANLLIAAARKDGHKGVQSFPFFGGERRGAPVRAFARIADSEINLRSQVYHPDIVVVLDPQLIGLQDVAAGLKPDGVIIINTPKKPEEFELARTTRVAVVDAAGISIRHDLLVSGIPIINTPILGAVPRVSSVVSLEALQAVIKEQWKSEIGDRNARAAKEAYEMTETNFQ
ncbi:MAG: 2-oxoacid:acceptor oxidoreductase family protein [Chloroflexota bacterium]